MTTSDNAGHIVQLLCYCNVLLYNLVHVLGVTALPMNNHAPLYGDLSSGILYRVLPLKCSSYHNGIPSSHFAHIHCAPCSHVVLAQSGIDYTVTYHTPSGSEFTSLTGYMLVPNKSETGNLYLWQGLQETTNVGIYQDVLDNRHTEWSIAPGWYSENTSV